MKPLYILDLEGTLGIFYSGMKKSKVNDTIILRPGVRELLDINNSGNIRLAITASVEDYFLLDVQTNLRRHGISLDCKLYSKADIDLKEKNLYQYKDYSKVYSDYSITDPESETIVIGDILNLKDPLYWLEDYSKKDFMDYDFANSLSVLTSEYSLNNHPFPAPDFPNTPVYVVLPTINHNQNTLDLSYVINFLDIIYNSGQNNFKFGLELFNKHVGMTDNQYVHSNDLAKNLLNDDFTQDYLVMKGREKNWKPLEKIL